MRTALFLIPSMLLLAFAIHARGQDQVVLVPAGSFVQGDGVAYCGEDERQVTLTRDFHLGIHEVTNQQYLEALQWAYDNGYVTATSSAVFDNLDGSAELLVYLGSDDYSEIRFDEEIGFWLRQANYALQYAYPEGYAPIDHPVKMVSWFGAARYCDWLSMQEGLPRAYEQEPDPPAGGWTCNGGDPYGAVGFRLPTDAEWEYAAQWDDERTYPWGDESPTCGRANYDYCVSWTAPPGAHPSAPDALGLLDMAGSVWELCNDGFVCSLGSEPVTDPVGSGGGNYRVAHGGSWPSHSSYLRCSARNHEEPHDHSRSLGFRIARSAPVSGASSSNKHRASIDLAVETIASASDGLRIVFRLRVPAAPTIGIYDVSGRLLRELRLPAADPGRHEIHWRAGEEDGRPIASGIHFVRLQVAGASLTRKALLLH